MNKQALTEALARYDEGIDYVDPEGDVLVAAARLVERLLPGECPHGKTEPHTFPLRGHPDVSDYCPAIQVWDEEIVGVVVSAIAQARLRAIVSVPGMSPTDEIPILARAVLSALVELLTEKVEE